MRTGVMPIIGGVPSSVRIWLPGEPGDLARPLAEYQDQQADRPVARPGTPHLTGPQRAGLSAPHGYGAARVSVAGVLFKTDTCHKDICRTGMVSAKPSFELSQPTEWM
jgi:hypothetical protein